MGHLTNECLSVHLFSIIKATLFFKSLFLFWLSDYDLLIYNIES